MLTIPSESVICEGRVALEEIERKLSIRSYLISPESVLEYASTKSKDDVQRDLDVILHLFNRMQRCIDITARRWQKCFDNGEYRTITSHADSNLSQLYLRECGNLIRGPAVTTTDSETLSAEKRTLSKHQKAFRPLRNKLMERHQYLEQKCTALREAWDERWDEESVSFRRQKMSDALDAARHCYQLGLYIIMTLLPGRTVVNLL